MVTPEEFFRRWVELAQAVQKDVDAICRAFGGDLPQHLPKEKKRRTVKRPRYKKLVFRRGRWQ
jgi:hypothetical protein